MERGQTERRGKMAHEPTLAQLFFKNTKLQISAGYLLLKILLYLFRNSFAQVFAESEGDISTCCEVLHWGGYIYQKYHDKIAQGFRGLDYLSVLESLEGRVEMKDSQRMQNNQFLLIVEVRIKKDDEEDVLPFKIKINLGLLQVVQLLHINNLDFSERLEEIIEIMILDGKGQWCKVDQVLLSSRYVEEYRKMDLNRQGYRQWGDEDENVQCSSFEVGCQEQLQNEQQQNSIVKQIYELSQILANGDFGTLFGWRKRVIEILQHLEEEFSMYYFDFNLKKELEKIIKVVQCYEDFPFVASIYNNSIQKIKELFDKLNKRIGITQTGQYKKLEDDLRKNDMDFLTLVDSLRKKHEGRNVAQVEYEEFQEMKKLGKNWRCILEVVQKEIQKEGTLHRQFQ